MTRSQEIYIIIESIVEEIKNRKNTLISSHIIESGVILAKYKEELEAIKQQSRKYK